ncbi:fatty acid-binding protein homolog 6 [Diabrotica virgifera virgifera]|uniref:Fatty acid-binding protein homolog 6-like n=1 Tax=Diabrotica virgifera virgifera TaxID=50390 RepID=A0A6P7F2M9_DIAVI|nr:fatty acid-binding protein homolog 6 [Diabrotica virgifera virgifera]
MVQIEGIYINDRSENLDDYFLEVGVPFIPRKLLCSSKPTLEIKRENDEWTITVSTLLRTNITTFKLGAEYEEHMPGGVLRNITTLENGKLITLSLGPGDVKSKREYEFTDEGCVITYSSEKTSKVAKRYFKRI